MKTKLLLLSATLSLSACFAQDPGAQCLTSFTATLKDPDSGKVIRFAAPVLTYSATNSYGARTQRKALCKQSDGKWIRDRAAESVAVLTRMAEKIEQSNECRKAGASGKDCAGTSLALRLAAIELKPVDQERLYQESVQELGF